MLKDITLGQYFPGNSFVHRLDPRTKLLLMSAYIVAVFIVGNMWLFTLVAAYVIGVTAIAGVPVSYLWRSLKPLRFILIFMFAINLLVTATGDTLFEWWIIKITTGGLRQAVYISLRLILLVSGTSLMTLTTTPNDLTDGLERVLGPCRSWPRRGALYLLLGFTLGLPAWVGDHNPILLFLPFLTVFLLCGGGRPQARLVAAFIRCWSPLG